MRKTEQKLWDRMRVGLNNKALCARHILLERLENSVGTGRPDVDALCDGQFTPIELKAVDAPPKRATTRLLPVGKGLSVDQLNWHLAWHQHGGRSLIVIGLGSREQFTIEGRDADLINTMCATELRLRSIASTWAELAAALGAAPVFRKPLAAILAAPKGRNTNKRVQTS